MNSKKYSLILHSSWAKTKYCKKIMGVKNCALSQNTLLLQDKPVTFTASTTINQFFLIYFVMFAILLIENNLQTFWLITLRTKICGEKLPSFSRKIKNINNQKNLWLVLSWGFSRESPMNLKRKRASWRLNLKRRISKFFLHKYQSYWTL